jgi:DNA-binding NarL/FixJ family response regulator
VAAHPYRHAAPRNPPGGAASVVVVTSDWRFREALLAVLREGRAVEVAGVAEDLEEAEELIEELRPTVVLMAYESPTGAFGLARELRRRRVTVPVVLLTEHSTDSEAYEALAAGFSGILRADALTPWSLCDAVRLASAGGFVARGSAVQDLLTRLVELGAGGSAVRYRLTPRELEILARMARGHANADIATEFGVTTQAVKNHVARILRKLGTPNRTAGGALAQREGLVED